MVIIIIMMFYYSLKKLFCFHKLSLKIYTHKWKLFETKRKHQFMNTHGDSYKLQVQGTTVSADIARKSSHFLPTLTPTVPNNSTKDYINFKDFKCSTQTAPSWLLSTEQS